MRRHIAILRSYLARALQADVEYRSDLAVHLANLALWWVVGFAVIDAMIGDRGQIAGWTFEQSLAVLGAAVVMEEVYLGLLAPNVGRLSDYVQSGSLDHMLLQPVDAQFQVSLRHVSVSHGVGVVIGLGLMGYSMAMVGTLTPVHALAAVALLGSGVVIFYAMVLMLMTTAFWFVRVENVTVFIYTFLGSGRYPASAYPAWLRAVFFVVVPIGFMTTVPAEAAVGTLTASDAAGSVAMAVLLLALGRWFWQRAIASYTSASS